MALRGRLSLLPGLSIRHAGGGGRPGGKPTFNWRERMMLRLARKDEKKLKPLKIAPTGDWADLEAYFDESRGDTMINISELDEFEAPDVVSHEQFEGPNDTRKEIDVSTLFGPHKPRGALERKRKPSYAKNFSHTRVFGRKKEALE